MTQKEQMTLNGIGDDLREMKGDVKALLSFQATYTEKCKVYDAAVGEISWLKKKMYLFMGAIAAIVFLIDKFIHGSF